MKKIKLISLFAGIGAMEFGAKRIYDEVEIVAAAEIDKYARISYMANHKIDENKFYSDVKLLDGKNYKEKYDCLCFGFPCQDYSIAGLRAGLDGQKGTLFYEAARILKDSMPEMFIAENVKGLLSSNKGKDFKVIMEILRDIGYHIHYEVLNTKDYGIPQNRERIFIVGFLDHEQYYRFQFAPKIKLEKRLRDVLESEVDEKYYLNRQLLDYKSQANTIHDIEKESPTICAFTHGYAGGYIKEPQCKVVGMLDMAGHDYIRRVHSVDGIAPTIPTGAGGNHEPKILDLTNDFGENKTREYTEYSPTLRSERFGLAVQEAKIQVVGNIYPSGHEAGNIYNTEGIAACVKCNGPRPNSKNEAQKIIENYRIRKLTPRECFRLQDFPDTFKFVVSNSQLYKQAGNSISVNVMEMIFNQIEKSRTINLNGGLF